MTKLSKPEKRMREKRDQKLKEMEQDAIAKRALQEWPSMRLFNQALRYLEVFAQLMKLTPFIEWMKENIEISDQIDHKNKTLDTFVIYKGKGQLSEDEPTINMVPDLQEAAEKGAEPLCAPDPDPSFAQGDNQVGPTPTRSPDQNIVCCPNCQLTFDANVEVSRIALATEIPKDAKIP